MKLRNTLRNVVESIVPRPKSVKVGTGTFRIEPGLALVRGQDAAGAELAVLFGARWKKAWGFAPEAAASEGRGRRSIVFELTDEAFDRAVPAGCTEAYRIVIGKHGVRLSGNTREGLYYAAMTFTNLVATVEGALLAPCLTLIDWPEFPYRSLLVAPGQGFMPWEEVKRTIDLVAHSKLNAMHLHLTDNNLFAFEMEAYPGLGGKGVIADEAQRGFYTRRDLKRIVAYAAERNVTIMPAIDFPGHAMAVLREFPELRCTPKKKAVSQHTMCIGTEATYEFLGKVIDELAPLFASPYFHIGTDEVEFLDVPQFHVFMNWNECPVCQARIKKEKLNGVRGLFYYFVRRVREMVRRHGKTLMMWNDQVDSGNPQEVEIPRDVVMQFWRIAAPGRGPEVNCSYEALVKLGFPIVNSFFPETYVDLYIKQERLSIWNPLNAPPMPAGHAPQMLGSTFCAWEHIPIYSRVLPSAIPFFADRVWNLHPVGDPFEFGRRVARHILGPQAVEGLDLLFEALGGVILPQNAEPTRLAHLERVYPGQTEAQRLESSRAMLKLIGQGLKSATTRDKESLREYRKCVSWVVEELAKRVQGIGI